MTRQISSILRAARGSLSALLVSTALSSPVHAINFSVGPDRTLNYPSSLTSVVDEHTTFIPPVPGSNAYLVFMASNLTGAKVGAGPVVLQTSDLQSFTFANGYSTPAMAPPVAFTTCNPLYDTEFDENYSAPGSVLQDPTLPPGNLMMIYEAENHCPGGVWQFEFYVTVGFARSSDNGKTWPASVNGPLGGPNRYPVLRLAASEPASEPSPAAMGNGLPSAFVDGNYLYVVYGTYPGPGAVGDGKLRVARAQLGGNGQLSFLKWYNGAFSQPGIGGLDSGPVPSGGCIGYQAVGQISYNDGLGLYLFTFVCGMPNMNPPQGAWYFSTATSLDTQNWTVPQLIENSQYPLTSPCPLGGGQLFDGWYPSFMSPGSPAGHTGLTGLVYFLNGCNGSLARTFNARVFAITPSASGPLVSTPIAAAVLPSSRSVTVGATATAFATIVNGGTPTAAGCTIAPATSVPANFSFQTTSSTTNALTGAANAPTNIASGAAQSFLLSLTPTAAFSPTDVAFTFSCLNANPAQNISGVNTLLLSASTTPLPDVVALAASGDPGILDIPGNNGSGAFAVASVNVGASATLTVSADTGGTSLPLFLTLCQTNTQTGQCLASPAQSVSTSIASGATPSFAVFATGAGQIAFAPAANRIFVRFKDSGGLIRGATSVAVRTVATAPASTSVTVSGVNLMRKGAVWNPHGAQIIAFVAPPAAQTSEFTAAYANYSTAELSAVKAWGADTIRFQVSQPGLDPQSSLYTSSFLAQVQAAVTYARSIGLNVIVCVQDEAQSGEPTPATLPNAATQRVWQTLAPLFNSDTGILYEIMNEPSLTSSAANWFAWQTAMNAVIATIRATGSTNVVVADGLEYAEVLNGAPLLTDSLSQVAYAVHPYFRSGFTANTFPTQFGNFASNAPVIVTEWDLSQNQYCDAGTPALALTMLQYLPTRNIGVVGYAYDNPGLIGKNYGTTGSIVQDFNGTPTTLSNNIQCGAVGFGPGTLLQNYFRSGSVSSVLQ